MLTTPLPNLAAWTDYFLRVPVPVLRYTARELEQLAEHADTVSAREIAAVVMRDPLMTLKVLAHVSERKSTRQISGIETIEAAVVMMGVPPFFAACRDAPQVENILQGQWQAHLGLMRVVTRACRAARFAQDWAAYRQDLDWEVIVIAALLHDLPEMLLWCFAPGLALSIAELQASHPHMRSRAAQKTVLGIELNDLEITLMNKWRLPELLLRMIDDQHADDPQVRNVVCGVNLARHSANGWNDAALPDDFGAIATLLSTTPQHVRTMVVPGGLA
jgi:HD-like signal output (HDOD) protein